MEILGPVIKMMKICRSLDMGMVFNIGQMVLTMKEIGTTTKLKGKVLSGMLRVMFIEVNLKMIWLMDMESILILMDRNTKGNSEMMCRKVMAKKNGLRSRMMSRSKPTSSHSELHLLLNFHRQRMSKSIALPTTHSGHGASFASWAGASEKNEALIRAVNTRSLVLGWITGISRPTA